MDTEEDIDMKEGSSPEVDPVVSSDEDDMEEERIAQMQKEVDASPYTYELHVRLINLCKELGELDSLRFAREKMSEVFPLSPELWLDWIQQEKSLAETSEQKEKLATLYERALKDYNSIDVWLEYLKFSIEMVNESWEETSIANCRRILEQAVSSMGIHVTQGCLIWEAYSKFEKMYLVHLKEQGSSSEEIKKQEEKVYNVFKRHLSIPSKDMTNAYAEFENLQLDQFKPDTSSIQYSYNKALKKLDRIRAFEISLQMSESPHYETWNQYIQFEKQEGEPIRVQNLYERALIENCIKEDMWLDYTRYVDQVIKIKEISLPIYERAVRNCPWSVQIWVSYVRALERYGDDHKKIIGVFETALSMGFTKAEDFKELWLAYVGYLRRKLDKETSGSAAGNKELDSIVEVYDRAVTQMKHYFWGSESEYIILKSWIVFTAKYKKDIENCRKLWKELIDHGHKEEARVWLDLANFEKLFGNPTHYKKALFSALSSVCDWQETFVDLLITFEREEGTLESLEKTLAKCEAQMKQVNEKRLRKLEEANSIERDEKKRSPSKRQARFHRSEDSTPKPPVKMDSEGFKIPPPPPDKSPSPGSSRSPETASDSDLNDRKRKPEEEQKEAPKKKMKVETSDVHGEIVKHDPSKDDRTVFLSNLSYQVEEDKIKEMFSEVGDVEEVRLVKDYKGRSKGFCYVVFKSQELAKSALSKDRQPLDGRPVLVSPCKDKKSSSSLNPAANFKFSTGLERNKLFIKNLPQSTTKEDLENMYKEFGALKEVRLVTYRNGHSKGLAYVEFKDDGCASAAVVETDGRKMGSHVISVAISNPPPRKPRKEVGVLESLGGGAGASRGPRGRGRTQLTLLPRSLARSRKPAPSVQNGSGPSPAKPLSNSDFARMLQRK